MKNIPQLIQSKFPKLFNIVALSDNLWIGQEAIVDYPYCFTKFKPYLVIRRGDGVFEEKEITETILEAEGKIVIHYS